MQVSWSDLLYSDSFQGEKNKPFADFLKSVTRIVALGHNHSSVQAHEKALAELSQNEWQKLSSFVVDERLVGETIAKKTSQTPGLTNEEREQVVELSRKFAVRCQLKSYVKDVYLELLTAQYAELNQNSTEIDWQYLLYKPATRGKNKTLLEACDSVAHRIFWNEELARKACDNAIKRMSENNWSQLAGYQGVGSAEGYFKKVFHTKVQDFFKAIYGTCQARTWIQNAGAVMVRLFKKLCCEKTSPTILQEHHEQLNRDLELAQNLERQHPENTLIAPLGKEQIADCIKLILQKEKDCLASKVEEQNDSATRIDDDGASVIDTLASNDFDDETEMAGWKGTLMALQILIGECSLEEVRDTLKSEKAQGASSLSTTVMAVSALLERVNRAALVKLQLTDNEKCVMQYRFIHNLSRNEAAAQMSLQLNKTIETHQVRYEEEKALNKLKKLLSDT